MMWQRKRRRDLEIAPDEIFPDASSAPTFDRARFEGRLERPLSPETFFSLFAVLALLFLALTVRAWNLQITRGVAYAEVSANNSLEVTTLFASRGIISDIHGVVLAENLEREDGSTVRRYPISSLSNIVGYVSYPKKDANGVYYDTSTTGLAGLEAQYDAILAGENGQLLIETDAFNRVRSSGSVIPAKEGKVIQLSVDADLQKHFAQAIASVVNGQRFIAGGGVIMDVQTGAVRAIASYPSYDSNVMASGSPRSTIEGYNSDVGHPFLDHAVQGVYAPGSIIKPFIAVGALTDGLITPRTIINDPGFLTIPDPYNPGKEFVYKGWKALGPVDVKQAIAWSSDIFFYTVGGGFKSQKGLGIDRLAYWYRQFGLGSPTGIDLPDEAGGIIPTPDWKRAVFGEPWYLGDTYFTAIGQYSMQVTPIQMARAAAALVNGGKLLTPTLLANKTPEYTSVPVDPAALSVVREGMRKTVTDALAQVINLPYLHVAAKTGTAQTGTRNQYDNSWLIGFFPYENPQYAFAVVLERGPEGTGERAVHVMRNLFESLYAAGSPYAMN